MFTFFFIALTTLVTIINPIGAIVPYLAMTINDPINKKKSIALRAAVVSSGILIFCALTGTFIFKFYGITLPALKIAGGILLFFIAFDMVNARASRTKTTEEEQNEGIEKDDAAIFPLAIPLLSGPGAIVSVFMLADQSKHFVSHMVLIVAIIISGLLSFLVLKSAPRLTHILGSIGMNIMNRLMGLMLAAIAVQFMLDGFKEALPGLI